MDYHYIQSLKLNTENGQTFLIEHRKPTKRNDSLCRAILTTRASLKPLRMRRDKSFIWLDWDDRRKGITLSTSLTKPILHKSFRLLIRAIIAFHEILSYNSV